MISIQCYYLFSLNCLIVLSGQVIKVSFNKEDGSMNQPEIIKAFWIHSKSQLGNGDILPSTLGASQRLNFIYSLSWACLFFSIYSAWMPNPKENASKPKTILRPTNPLSENLKRRYRYEHS